MISIKGTEFFASPKENSRTRWFSQKILSNIQEEKIQPHMRRNYYPIHFMRITVILNLTKAPNRLPMCQTSCSIVQQQPYFPDKQVYEPRPNNSFLRKGAQSYSSRFNLKFNWVTAVSSVGNVFLLRTMNSQPILLRVMVTGSINSPGVPWRMMLNEASPTFMCSYWQQ